MIMPAVKTVFFLLLISLFPVLSAAGLQGYPAIVASQGGDAIFLNDIAARLLPAIAGLDPEKDRQQVEKLFRAAVEQHACLKILHRELVRKGIPADRHTAAAYIDRHCRRFGREGEGLRKQMNALILHRDFQLKAAMHTYFEKYSPGETTVSDAEIEHFYRLNQKRFLAPARVDAGVIAVSKQHPDARNRAADAAARLRQGENFDTVARIYNPEGSVKSLSPEVISQVKDPVKGRIYEVEDQQHHAVIMIRECSTVTYQPLAAAAPVIAEELAAAKMSRVMQKMLTAELAKAPVIYAADLPCMQKAAAVQK